LPLGRAPLAAFFYDRWNIVVHLAERDRHMEAITSRPLLLRPRSCGRRAFLAQSKNGKRLLDHLASANRDANPELMRLTLKLATRAGKTTVMAMLIARQTVNIGRNVSTICRCTTATPRCGFSGMPIF
jgi:hypothetical protein